jgi:hypothetical protein
MITSGIRSRIATAWRFSTTKTTAITSRTAPSVHREVHHVRGGVEWSSVGREPDGGICD